MSSFSVGSLFASFIFSVIGLYYFRAGKKELNYTLLFVSIALIGYSYFVTGPALTWGIGFALWATAYYVREHFT